MKHLRSLVVQLMKQSFTLYPRYIIQGMVMYADISVGQNTLAVVQSTHEPQTQQTYSKAGKQRLPRIEFYGNVIIHNSDT